MAAKGKEVVPQADTRLAEHFAPDRGDLLLQRTLRFKVLTHLPLRFRQGLAIQLAAGAQGHGIEAHQLRGHHIVWQLGGQCVLEAFVLLRFGLGAGDAGVVADQLRTGGGFAYQYHGLGHLFVGQQPRFDFLRLQPEAAQFDLLVETAEVFQHAVGIPAHPVAGTVQTRARLSQWVGDKALGRQPRPSQITPGQADTANAQLPGNTRGQWVEVGIEDPGNHIAQRPADGRTLAVRDLAVPVGHVDRGFGRSVAVVQLHIRQGFQGPVAQLGGQGFATGKQPPQTAASGHLRLMNEKLQQCRDEVQRGHAVGLHQLRDTLRVTVFAGAGEHQAAAADQRPEAFPDRYVEADRGLLHQHIAVIQRVGRLHPLQALGQGRVGVTDALGLAGGAGGIDHIGEVIAVKVQARCLARPGVELEQVEGDGADPGGYRQAVEQMTLGQQQFDAAVGEHVGQALGRIVRIQRHIGAAGLDDGEQADQQLRRTLDGDGHPHVRADALVPQVVGQAVGLGVQGGEVETAALPLQGNAFRSQPGLLFEQLRQPLPGRGTGRRAPFDLPCLFSVIQQLYIGKRPLRLGTDLTQQADEMSGQTLDSRRVE